MRYTAEVGEEEEEGNKDTDIGSPYCTLHMCVLICRYSKDIEYSCIILQVSGFRFRSNQPHGGWLFGALVLPPLPSPPPPPPSVSLAIHQFDPLPSTHPLHSPPPLTPPQMATSLRSSLHGLSLGPSKPKSQPTDPFSDQERIIVGIDFGYLFAFSPFALHCTPSC